MSAGFGARDIGSQGGPAEDNLKEAASLAASSIGATAADNQNASPEVIEAELQHYNLLLGQLLGVISRSEEESVSRVISAIRSGASHRQILDLIEQLPNSQAESSGPI
ncbi:hypothetical protein PENDEC_c037G02182 [Penicillium decumbens]|uniref:Uncharacterized protein n=1 Tax=Penicillium decumbens TaxID=69771 RepID=A0A1V6NSC0_PENDC|nr:hypothetical protein PENDEC_c037G02182 [Penicillium decumbens]